MSRRTTHDSGPAEAGAGEEEESASTVSISPPPPPPAAASSAGAITTSPSTAAPSAAGIEYHPSSDDAPVPLAQMLAAYDEAEEGNSKPKGVEVIESSGDDVPMPVAMMDTSRDHDRAEKGFVELVDDDDEPAPPPGHIADDGSDSKIIAKKTVGRVRKVRPRAAAARPADSIVREPAFEEDAPENLRIASAPRGEGVPSGDVESPPAPEPSEPSPPILHARLVEDEPEQPVYDAVPVGEEHWAKRHQRKIIGGLLLAIVALVVALGVAFGTGGGDVIFATSPPTRSLSPSSQPTMYPRPCFVDREELKAAVDDYIAGGPRCWRGDSECEVIQRYGWPIGSWCTSNVTDMSYLFHTKGNFDEDLSSWNTSSVTTMENMFSWATSFSEDLSHFDTSKVTSMSQMFREASSFNGDVSSFDTSKVTSMSAMFSGASSFNGDLSSFNTSQVISMRYMFQGASSFNGDISNFDTSNVTSMNWVFEAATSFNRDVSNFDTSKVTSMWNMFKEAYSFNMDLSNFDTSNVTSMNWMFNGANSFNQDVSGWDVASVTNMYGIFEGATSFSQNLCAWGAHYNATGVNYQNMFLRTSCPSTSQPDGPYTNWCEATCNSTDQSLEQ